MRLEVAALCSLAVGAVSYVVYKAFFSKEANDNMGCLESKPEYVPPEPQQPPMEKKQKVQAPTTVNDTKAKPVAASAAPKQQPAQKEAAKKAGGEEEYSWNKKKLDPKDFMFSNLKGQVCIKEPGAINGQAFIIEDCEDCDIYLCDTTAQVQVDYCKRCRIFIGPVESSIFIRNW